MSLLTRGKKDEVDQVTPENLDVPDERPFPGFVRVNLIPPTIQEREKVRRVKRIIAVLMLGVLLLLAGLWYLAQRDIAAAEERLEAAQLRQIQLEGELAQYAEVPLVFATASKGEQALSDAMSAEVRWAFLLNQLSFATPAGVTLNTVVGQIAAEGPTQTSPGEVLPPMESVGTMTFAGSGSSFSEVAAWLDSLQSLKDYTYPFLTNSSKSEATDTTTTSPAGGQIAWESTANLSPNALSGRYGTPPAAGTTEGTTGGGTSGAQPTTPEGTTDGAGEAAS